MKKEIGTDTQRPVVHVCAPPPISESYRVLPKYGRKFVCTEFTSWPKAFKYGIENHPTGFRVFFQSCYEWYEPTNTELIKVRDLTKTWNTRRPDGKENDQVPRT